MLSGDDSKAEQAFPLTRVPATPIALSTSEKTLSLCFALITAGYASFADAIACLFMVKPIRSEYHFEEGVTEEQWFAVSVFIAATYGFYTFSAEGKGSYDTAQDFFLDRHRKAAALRAPASIPATRGRWPLLVSFDPEPQKTKPQRTSCRQKITLLSVGLAARLICLIGSAADSTETTMGLAEGGAGIVKMSAVSLLSFLGSIAFYGPITVEAFEELFLGKKVIRPEPRASYKLALVIGYPIAFFSGMQDTLECSAGFFDNFKITNSAGQWSLVSISSLAGISSLCLDGRIGVEILDNFLGHLQTQYDWLPEALRHCQLPTRAQGLQLLSGGTSLALALYAASYIAFADKELTFSLTRGILKTLGMEVPGLPELLGWCLFLRDFVIQTKTYHRLEGLLISALNQLGDRLRQPQAPANPLFEIELALRPAEAKTAEPAEEEEEETSEEMSLLARNRPTLPREEKPRSCWSRLFKPAPRYPGQSTSLPTQNRQTCTIL